MNKQKIEQHIAKLEDELNEVNIIDAGLKITLNGCFGKTSSPYSFLYAPDLLAYVTLTGQLTLLMLIDRVAATGAEVVSANTDGIVILAAKDDRPKIYAVLQQFEEDTGFALEYTPYKALFSESVNSYVGVKPDGTTKEKGFYAKTSLMKNPVTPICSRAVRECLSARMPVAETINAEQDVTQFLTSRTVRGGAVYGRRNPGDTPADNEVYLGKVVRWHYSNDEDHRWISYDGNGNKVPKTDRSAPMMKLTGSVPEDLDREWYIEEAELMLRKMGLQYGLDDLKI